MRSAASSATAAGEIPAIPGATHRTVTIATHDVGPLDVHVIEAGSGPPVLMLHGWPQDAWCWHDVIALLADDYRLICPDLRGFGWSAAPGSGYNGQTFGADAIALLDALGIERAFLVGHDWGGFAAFAAAIAAPHRFERMLVLNTAPPWTPRSPRLLLTLWRVWYVVALAIFGERLTRRPELIARVLRADSVQGRIGDEEALAYARRLARPESAHATKLLYRSYLRSFREVALKRRYDALRLTVPTRFLFGARDRAISPLVLSDLERHCDDIVVELVEDSGHFVANERPELVAQRARELFGGAGAGAPGDGAAASA